MITPLSILWKLPQIFVHFLLHIYVQSNKSEINLMKMLGVVSQKAGRTLLYRISDVAKMYPHWKMIIPEFIEELAAGKVKVQSIL